MKTIKIIHKAYRVYVHSHIGEYPIFCVDDIEPVYAKDATEAKGNCDFWNGKNEHGDEAKWIDIKCRRAKEYDKIEYKGQQIKRYQLEEVFRKERRIAELNKLPDNETFYVQDSRNYVGNSVLWWGLGSSGYVTQLDRAQKYTKAEILKDFSDGRETDIIWLASHVENNIKTHVDIQYLTREFSY